MLCPVILPFGLFCTLQLDGTWSPVYSFKSGAAGETYIRRISATIIGADRAFFEVGESEQGQETSGPGAVFCDAPFCFMHEIINLTAPSL